jgi:hypothetical protein
LLLIATLGFVLYRFPPERYSFYPLCPIHEYLHLLCPGCGATRALSALLHGDLTAALHFNALAILIVLPLAALYAAICFKRALRDGPFRYPAVPRSATIGLIVLATVFTVYRNL